MSRGSLASTKSSGASATTDVVRGLLAGAIDYAGLFPPSALGMADALRNYAAYRASADAPMLGRFVAPAARLNELSGALSEIDARGVRISAVLGLDPVADLHMIAAFNDRTPPERAAVDAIEAKADRAEAIGEIGSRAGKTFEVFVEVPLDGDVERLVDAARSANVRAKIRTGGVTADAFPSSRAVVRFMRACLDRGVPFKATAGLHHPLTGTYPLTYAADSPRGSMFGFLNVFLAAAFLRAGMPDANVALLLDDRDATAFSLNAHGAEWRGHRVDAAALAATHDHVFGSFGSCSFREPVDELRAMALA
jgi:hypothetical protein